MFALAPGQPAAPEKARAQLDSSDATTRLLAVEALSRVDWGQAAPAIERMTGDNDPRVRAVAIDCLAKINGRESWTIYLRGLNDTEVIVQRAAWAAIRAFSTTGDIAEILQLADTHPRFARSMRIRANHLTGRDGAPDEQNSGDRLD